MKDPQSQTFVTKHDLALLHKKIIATDLIVQKYQEANKALVTLQIENDHLKQQIEQITNECCIFGKQVTECTQECDYLKEQIEMLTAEKREVHGQLRLLQDENTNYYHEIMVLKQYESLKEINDVLTKTNERQQKELAKAQLKLQRRLPIVFKSNRTNQEPSESDIALIGSQKSVRELKLALGRLMNFIQTSNIEVPISLHIRPVLKAHDINDDFLESEGEFVVARARKASKAVADPVEREEEDDDNDFVDVIGGSQSATVNAPVPPVEANKKPSKSSSHEQQTKKKKKEPVKQKKTKKSSAKQRRADEEHPSSELDDLANELEMAISKPDQRQSESTSLVASFFSDGHDKPVDDTRSTITFSEQQPKLTAYTLPTLRQRPVRSTAPTSHKPVSYPPVVPISNEVSSLSDDDDVDNVVYHQPSSPRPRSAPIPIVTPPHPAIVETALSSSSPPPPTPSIDRAPVNMETFDPAPQVMPPFSEDDDDNDKQSNARGIPSLTGQSDAASPMDVILPGTSSPFMPLFSEDDEDKQSEPLPMLSTNPLTPQSSSAPLLVLETPAPSLPADDVVPVDMEIPGTISQSVSVLSDDEDTHMTPSFSEPMSVPASPMIQPYPSSLESTRLSVDLPLGDSNADTRPSPPSVSSTNDVPQRSVNLPVVESTQKSLPVQKLDSKRLDIVLRLLRVLTQVPPRFTPLRLSRRRTQKPSTVRREPAVAPPVTVVDDAITTAPMTHAPCESQSIVAIEQSSEDVEDDRMETEVDSVISVTDDERTVALDEPYMDAALLAHLPAVPDPPMLVPPQESTSTNATTQLEPTFVSHTQAKSPTPATSSDTIMPSPLKSSHIEIVSRLLRMLTTLPIKPVPLPISLPSRTTRKRKAAVIKPAVPLLRQPSTPMSPVPTRMQTRSLNAIRTCIARCNRPTASTRKRPTLESPPPVAKRMRPTIDEYHIVDQFFHRSSNDISDPLKNFLERKLQEDIVELSDHLYRLVGDMMMKKCDMILPLVKHLHPHEESTKVLLMHLNSKSTVFHQSFLPKLNQAFDDAIRQSSTISNNHLKILNRFFFLACSTFASSSVVVYARLFDIGYHLSQDILFDALSCLQNLFSPLISPDAQRKASTLLLHRLLLEVFTRRSWTISLNHLEGLLVSFQKDSFDHDDLLRCFILIARHQPWLWCAKELCSKCLLPLIHRIEQQQQRLAILIVLQYALFLHKDNADFQRDVNSHDQIQQCLRALATLTSDECVVRDQILFILHTRC